MTYFNAFYSKNLDFTIFPLHNSKNETIIDVFIMIYIKNKCKCKDQV